MDEEEEEEEALSGVHKLLAGAAAELIGRFGSEDPSVDAPSDKFQVRGSSSGLGSEVFSCSSSSSSVSAAKEEHSR